MLGSQIDEKKGTTILWCPSRLVQSPRMRVDLNADVGEAFGSFTFGRDDVLMRSITSASIAAGFHAGDPSILRRTIRAAKSAGVAIGAHPGFPDLAGFGRRELQVSLEEAEDLVLYQVAAVAGVAATEGVRLQHVKLHGAFYNMAARDRALADAVVRAIVAVDRSLVLFAPGGSALLAAGRAGGLTTAAEAFADRAYENDGSLVPRGRPGAVLSDPVIAVPRAIHMVRDQAVVVADGTSLPLGVETICVHSDTPGADSLVSALRAALEATGIDVKAIRQP
jgi:UPF0271 protein